MDSNNLFALWEFCQTDASVIYSAIDELEINEQILMGY